MYMYVYLYIYMYKNTERRRTELAFKPTILLTNEFLTKNNTCSRVPSSAHKPWHPAVSHLFPGSARCCWLNPTQFRPAIVGQSTRCSTAQRPRTMGWISDTMWRTDSTRSSLRGKAACNGVCFSTGFKLSTCNVHLRIFMAGASPWLQSLTTIFVWKGRTLWYLCLGHAISR